MISYIFVLWYLCIMVFVLETFVLWYLCVMIFCVMILWQSWYTYIYIYIYTYTYIGSGWL